MEFNFYNFNGTPTNLHYMHAVHKACVCGNGAQQRVCTIPHDATCVCIFCAAGGDSGAIIIFHTCEYRFSRCWNCTRAGRCNSFAFSWLFTSANLFIYEISPDNKWKQIRIANCEAKQFRPQILHATKQKFHFRISESFLVHDYWRKKKWDMRTFFISFLIARNNIAQTHSGHLCWLQKCTNVFNWCSLPWSGSNYKHSPARISFIAKQEANHLRIWK